MSGIVYHTSTLADAFPNHGNRAKHFLKTGTYVSAPKQIPLLNSTPCLTAFLPTPVFSLDEALVSTTLVVGVETV